VQLALWDTAGQEEYERLRPMSYAKAHVILIAFAVDTPDSLDNVANKVSLPDDSPFCADIVTVDRGSEVDMWSACACFACGMQDRYQGKGKAERNVCARKLCRERRGESYERRRKCWLKPRAGATYIGSDRRKVVLGMLVTAQPRRGRCL
jgi:hypothetical protein